jgi:N6-L-threonylcarbamoyladenine synthase
MRILGIESSCDETGIALVEDGEKIIFSSIASSIVKQRKFGGVVPEVAAREQLKFIIPLLAKFNTQLGFGQIDSIAVCNGPGLIGSLLIGVETAKTLAFVLDKPLIPVNHLVGHIYSNWLQLERNSKFIIQNSKKPEFPLVALIVSGGHTDLVLMKNHGEFKLLGSTLDDACGEAFDKVARFLGLPYPGGPEIERMAKKFMVHGSPIRGLKGKHCTVKFPRSMINSDDFNFSFSGIKTAVVNFVHNNKIVLDMKNISSISHEFQKAVSDVLVFKTLMAALKFNVKSVVVGGGVAANMYIRAELSDAARKIDVNVFYPSLQNSMDNGAMIATAAFFVGTLQDPLTISADSSLHF